MKTKHFTALVVTMAVSLACTASPQGPSLAEYVNPFIGASSDTGTAGASHGLGKTFPGADTPFGMTQVSPNTITARAQGAGYSYEHKTIEGFAFMQMSGVGWNGELGNFLVMPTTGPLQVLAGKEDGLINGWRSTYDKATETGMAGYYSVMLTRYGIRTEATATPHGGLLQFTFPENGLSRIQVDLARRVGGTASRQYVKVVDANTIEGWIECLPEGGGWGNGNGKVSYTLHYYAQLSKPIKNYGFWSADIPADWTRKVEDVTSLRYLERVAAAEVIRGKSELEGRHIGFFTEFDTAEGEKVLLRAAFSFVDIEGARQNYKKELYNKDFAGVKKEAAQIWDKELARIKITGGTEDQKTVFYTSMYHTMIDPRICSDLDGRYVGGDNKIHQEKGFKKRTVFSGWDVFRSQFPLLTLINPQVVDDEINSLTTLAEETGREYYERWELLNSYSGCMLGNPALSVLTDAYVKGIRGYDAEKTLKYAVKTSETFGNGDKGYSVGRTGISQTLEYAYFDWCIARMAETMGKKDLATEYYAKSKNYRNLFDAEQGWFRPRQENGQWSPWPKEGRLREGYGTTESNPYQQGWFVPHDIYGLAELLGGREKTLSDLESMFDNTPEDMFWNLYYNHANEPVHLVPFMFNRLEAPWLTQKWTRLVCERAYKNKVEGLVGNEDVGQMSAWYVLAAIGLHPACPGETRIEITSPVFDKAEIALDKKYFKGKKFTVVAVNNSPENLYIQSARLNGKPYDKCHLDFSQITAGGTLELTMGPNPNKNWGKQ